MKKEVSYKIVSLVFAILVICFLAAFYVLGWTEPTAVPPGGNVPAPINVGGSDQWKDGRLGVGGGTPPEPRYWLTDVGNSLYFQNRLNETKMVIGENGNVGIGTPSPDKKLHIFAGDVDEAPDPNTQLVVENSGHAGINILAGATFTAQIIFGDSGSANAGGIRYDHNTDSLKFGTNTRDSDLVLNNVGNVGIGRSPRGDTRLDVYAISPIDRMIGIGSAGTADANLFFDASDGDYRGGDYWALVQPLVDLKKFYIDGPNPDVTGIPELIILKDGGNVGIGTINPGAKLHVGGTAGTDGIMFPDGTLQTTAYGGLQTYDSLWFPVSKSVTYTKAHGFGAVPFMVQVWYSDTPDGSGDVVLVGAAGDDAAYGRTLIIVDVDATNIKIRGQYYVSDYFDANGVRHYVNSGYARIKAIR